MTDYGNGASGDYMPGDSAFFCQCEHLNHSSEEEDNPSGIERTGAHHPYGQSDSTVLVEFKTIYGPYLMCEHCMKDHPYPEDYLL